MRDGHLRQDFFHSLLQRGVEGDPLFRRLRDHLLDVCPTCREAYETARSAHEECTRSASPVASPPATDPLEALARGETPGSPAVSDIEDWELETQVRDLTALPAEQRLEVLLQQGVPHDRLPDLVTALCSMARKSSPKEALSWARLAEDVTRLEGEFPRHGGSLALALAFQGNALTRQVRDREALRLLEQAWAVLREMAVEDDTVMAGVSYLTAVLYTALRRYDEARELLENAETLYRALHRTEDRARALIQLGVVYDFQDQPDLAYEVTYGAIHLFRPWENPRLYVCGFCNLARYLCSQGKFEDALEVAMVDSAMVEEMDASIQANYQWLLARIYEGLGDDRVAERHFRRARTGFLELGNGFDFAIISLHLASLCYRNYRRGEALELATQALHLARTHGLHPEAQAALALLSEVLHSQATAGLILTEVTRFVQTIRNDPEAKFIPPKIE